MSNIISWSVKHGEGSRNVDKVKLGSYSVSGFIGRRLREQLPASREQMEVEALSEGMIRFQVMQEKEESLEKSLRICVIFVMDHRLQETLQIYVHAHCWEYGRKRR